MAYIGIRNDLDIFKPLTIIDKDVIWHDLWFALTTLPNTRVKMLDYGTHLRLFLHEPNDDVLISQARTEIIKVIDEDPRIVLIELDVTASENILYIKIVVDMIEINIEKILNYEFLRKV